MDSFVCDNVQLEKSRCRVLADMEASIAVLQICDKVHLGGVEVRRELRSCNQLVGTGQGS